MALSAAPELMFNIIRSESTFLYFFMNSLDKTAGADALILISLIISSAFLAPTFFMFPISPALLIKKIFLDEFKLGNSRFFKDEEQDKSMG